MHSINKGGYAMYSKLIANLPKPDDVRRLASSQMVSVDNIEGLISDYSHGARCFFLTSLGLTWPVHNRYALAGVKALLLDPYTAPQLRDNMVEFYLGLSLEYLGILFLETHRDTELTLFEFKYQIVHDVATMPLHIWVKQQLTSLEIIESWDSI